MIGLQQIIDVKGIRRVLSHLGHFGDCFVDPDLTL